MTTCDNNPNGPVTRQSANVCATGKSNFKLCNVACLATKRLTSIKCAQADADAAFSESSSLIPLSFGINCTSPVLSPSSKLPGIINAVTITLVTLVSYSAMAGTVGGGGLGDVGIRYGYQRFDGTVMAITVVVLIVLVQIIQSVGDHLVKRVDHR